MIANINLRKKKRGAAAVNKKEFSSESCATRGGQALSGSQMYTVPLLFTYSYILFNYVFIARRFLRTTLGTAVRQ